MIQDHFSVVSEIPDIGSFRPRLSAILDEREPAWKESGKNFIESVTTLLERLLDYRNALQVTERDFAGGAP